MSAFSFTRVRAITNDIEPLRISQRRTAEAGEYASAEGVETREWCMTMDNAAFWTAKVTKLANIVSETTGRVTWATHETYLRGIPKMVGTVWESSDCSAPLRADGLSGMGFSG
jgi:hypothetical protein